MVKHLLELRKRMIWTALVFVVSLGIGLWFAGPMLAWLKASPPAEGLAWNVFSPWDGLRLYMQLALVVGVGVTTPFALYHVWAFAKPGLLEIEQRATLRYIPVSVLLFAGGALFGYFIVFRMALQFTVELNGRLGFTEVYGAAQYFSFLLQVVLPVALMFELPVVVLFLTRIGLLSSYRLRKLRRYAYVVLTVVATAITPPDFVSALVVLAPLVALYEISTRLSVRMERRLKRLESEARSGRVAGTV